MAALRELGVCCCKAACAGNGCSIGKHDNVAAVRAKPRPKGLEGGGEKACANGMLASAVIGSIRGSASVPVLYGLFETL